MATGALVLTALAACSSPSATQELDAQPERIAHGKEVYHFNSLEDMTATADLVVQAHVASVKPGRWIGPPGGADGERVREVTLQVDRVVLSRIGDVPANITLDEWGWDNKGNGYQFENVTWTKAGDQGYYFLTRTPEVANNFGLISSQGRLLVQGNGSAAKLNPSAGKDDEIHAALSALPPSTFEEHLRKTAADAKSGKIKPVEKSFREQ
ncbi:hypothetical protein [Krasilnikovia sp. M28-CT-15]|uniref:hypothetical protein n=1 Tax=Krasilnikovia sp. M28-CT-15 TaxID=3373540 RepID=UPI00399C633B